MQVFETNKTVGEVEELYNKCQDNLEDSDSGKFRKLTFEDGIIATIEWLSNVEQNPLELAKHLTKMHIR